MSYARYRPSARLEPYVESIWVQEDHTDASTHPFPATRVLPTGSADVAFYFLEPFEQLGADGPTRLPRAVLTGPQTRYREYAATGRTGIVLVRFRPGAAVSCLRVPMQEARDQNVDLQDCMEPGRVRVVVDRIRAAATNAERVAIVQEFVESMLQAPTQATVLAAIERIVRRKGCDRVTTVACEAGLSSRQLQRRFREQVGISPKMLGRLVRFQHALELHATGCSWAMTALDAGYQDQSHFANDCRSLCGLSPEQVARRQRRTPLARYFNSDDGNGSAFRTVYL